MIHRSCSDSSNPMDRLKQASEDSLISKEITDDRLHSSSITPMSLCGRALRPQHIAIDRSGSTRPSYQCTCHEAGNRIDRPIARPLSLDPGHRSCTADRWTPLSISIGPVRPTRACRRSLGSPTSDWPNSTYTATVCACGACRRTRSVLGTGPQGSPELLTEWQADSEPQGLIDHDLSRIDPIPVLTILPDSEAAA